MSASYRPPAVLIVSAVVLVLGASEVRAITPMPPPATEYVLGIPSGGDAEGVVGSANDRGLHDEPERPSPEATEAASPAPASTAPVSSSSGAATTPLDRSPGPRGRATVELLRRGETFTFARIEAAPAAARPYAPTDGVPTPLLLVSALALLVAIAGAWRLRQDIRWS